MHMISGKSGELIAKRNCFGWYVIGTFASQVNQQPTRISSVDVGTVSELEDMKKLLTQDLMGVRLTELCTCRDRDLQENKFIKSISESTKNIDGRVQVRMSWREDGPPNESNYDAAYKRMISLEKSFKKKDCTEIIDSEVQKLVELEFITEIPPFKRESQSARMVSSLTSGIHARENNLSQTSVGCKCERSKRKIPQ